MAEANSQEFKIKIGNSANIRSANEYYNSILPALQDSESVELDLSGCGEADLSFVQIVESARLYARTSGKTIHLSSPADGAVLEVLRRAGFLDDMTAADARFWLHQEVA